MRPTPASIAATLLVTLLAGCGSTVSPSSIARSPASDGLAPQTSSLTPRQDAPADPAASVGMRDDASHGASSPLTLEPGTSDPGGELPGRAAPGYGPGVTDKVMYVGYRVKVNGEQANAAAGGAGISTGDEELNFKILIGEINAHGGIAGRKVIPVFHRVDATTTETGDQLVSEMCSDWTEDHHIFASTFGGDRGLLTCLDKARVVTSYDNLGTSAAEVFKTFRYYAEVSLLNLNRLADAEVKRLSARHWFTPWDATLGAAGGPGTKVGVITYDDDSFKSAVRHNLEPALKSAGYPAVRVVYAHVPQTTAELSQDASDVSNAILKFRQEGIEHVIVLDASGTLTLLFLNTAQGQHYFPRYGFNSQNAPQVLLTGGDVQAQQLVGSMGIGWFPTLDLRPEDNADDGPYSNTARRRCITLFRQHGVTFKDANAKGVALLTCSSTYFLKAAVERGLQLRPGPINRDTFLAGVNALGESFESPMTFGTRFGPDRHDGADLVRDFSFQQSCTCVRYVSGPWSAS